MALISSVFQLSINILYLNISVQNTQLLYICIIRQGQQQIITNNSMSIASFSYKQKSLQQSSDVQDLRQHVKVLTQENRGLTLQLEELIEVNNQLTTSIQEYSKLHQEKFGSIDQVQLQQFANQVAQPQRELHQQKQINERKGVKNNPQLQLNQQNSTNPCHPSNQATENNGLNIQQVFQVIKQLTDNIHYLQKEYQQQLQNLQLQLYKQKSQQEHVFKQMEQKFVSFNDLSKQLLSEIHSRDQVINNLNRQLSIQRNKKSQIHKQMKISFTIQDLKNTLERKIQQKNQIIKSYQILLSELKKKIADFVI